jgi:hypothetical protein
VPSDVRLERMREEVPLPTDIRIITAATPMTTPRMVKKLLSLCVTIDIQAVLNGSRKDLILFPP